MCLRGDKGSTDTGPKLGSAAMRPTQLISLDPQAVSSSTPEPRGLCVASRMALWAARPCSLQQGQGVTLPGGTFLSASGTRQAHPASSLPLPFPDPLRSQEMARGTDSYWPLPPLW